MHNTKILFLLKYYNNYCQVFPRIQPVLAEHFLATLLPVLQSTFEVLSNHANF